MKKITDNNIFWMVVSLLASLTLWIFVSSNENDTISKQFNGVTVELLGESILQESKGLTVSDLSTNTVSVTISGPRRILSTLSSDSLKATVDVSKLSQSAYATMQYSISFPNGIDTSSLTVSRKVPDSVNFTVSKIIEKEIPVKGIFNGFAKEGYSVESIQCSPSTIIVSGPEYIVNTISYISAEVTAEDITSTYVEEVGITLNSESGSRIEKDGLTFSSDIVTVTVPILAIKNVNLGVSIISGGGVDENNYNVSIEPQYITIKGDTQKIGSLNQLIIGSVDLSQVESSPYTKTFSITLDNDITNVSGETEAEFTIEFLGVETKTLNVTDFRIENCPEGYESKVENNKLTVKIRGTSENISQIKDSNVYIVLDMTEFTNQTGSVDVPAKVYVEGYENCGAVGSYSVQVTLKKVE